jgi:excinuclease UvrABC nuclease subunit
MIVSELVPKPSSRESFRRNRLSHVPNVSGCYVITTFSGEILYVGLATYLRSRMEQHLNDGDKTRVTAIGKAWFFHWMITTELEKVERTWMQAYRVRHGVLPPMNSLFSPTAT